MRKDPFMSAPSLWRRLLSWIFRRAPDEERPSSTDDYFAAVADGREPLTPPVPAVLKPSSSSKRSPLAAAYAASANTPPETAGASPAARWQVVEPPASPDA